jgi:serine protease Do
VYPQLADRFHLGTDHGAWVQSVTPGGPAAGADLQGGGGSPVTFQAQSYRLGGDVVTAVDGIELRNEDDLSQAISAHSPGETVTLSVVSGTRRHEVEVRLAPRPAAGATP